MASKTILKNKKKNTNKVAKVGKLNDGKVSNPHDSYIKRMMSFPEVSHEFMEIYLDPRYKELVDLSTVRVEQESFINDKLQNTYSDILFSVKTKNQEDAYIAVILLEHQSTVDYWFMLKLMGYIISYCQKYKTDHNDKHVKLPLICPILISNANKPYDAPLKLEELFNHEEIAKEMLTKCRLLDLYVMPEDHILKHKALWIMEFCLKYAKIRDKVNLLEEFFKIFNKLPPEERAKKSIYLPATFCYITSITPEKQHDEIDEILEENLSKQDKEGIMRTVADLYVEKFEEKFIAKFEKKFIEKWKAPIMQEGILEGMEKEALKVATKMLNKNMPLKDIIEITELSKDVVFELSKKSKKEPIT